MKPILYHYSHCPFCIRVRMAAGFLNINYETRLLRYDDEQTPTKLIGKKMLPIWVNVNGNSINESLDIISLIDTDDILKVKTTLASPEWKSFEKELNIISDYIHSLAMPHFMCTKEFDDKSRAYFQRKKQEKRGSFEVLVKNRKLFETELQEHLNELDSEISEFYNGKSMSLYDILLASHLWALYIVPEFQFRPRLHEYLQRVKTECRFDYQDDLWK